MTRDAALAVRPVDRLTEHAADPRRISTMPVEELASAIAEERRILADVQHQAAAEPANDEQPAEIAEQQWSLPQGTFKTTTRKPVAGQTRKPGPFNPNAK